MSRFARTGARTAAALIAAASLALAAGPASAAGKKKKAVPPITMTGTVYTFDNQDPIAGATVRVAELPGLSAVSDANGVYRLTIPGGTRFTPYADAAGHHRIYLQTWVSHGRDLRGVNFQMPTNDIYVLLAGITGAPLGPDGELVNCAVVSTFVNEAVRDLTFDQFVAFGAHGVAGATATAFPPLPKPIYFNESVIPDRNRTNSSVDGGVVWPIVPTGALLVPRRPPDQALRPVPGDLRARARRQREPGPGAIRAAARRAAGRGGGRLDVGDRAGARREEVAREDPGSGPGVREGDGELLPRQAIDPKARDPGLGAGPCANSRRTCPGGS